MSVEGGYLLLLVVVKAILLVLRRLSVTMALTPENHAKVKQATFILCTTICNCYLCWKVFVPPGHEQLFDYT